MNVLEAISTKRAVQTFTDRPLPDDVIRKILTAGRHAQSSKNMQPWHFIAIQDKDTLKALSELGDYAGHLSNASIGVAIVTPPPEKRFSIMFDTGQAAAYMQLAAWEIGICSCLATIYQPDEARKLLDFPKNLHIRVAISFGYPFSDETSPHLPRRGGRRDFDDVVHFEKW